MAQQRNNLPRRPGAPVPGQKRPGRPQAMRGDFTGQQRETLASESEAAVEARREELGMVTAAQSAVRDNGVINITDGEPQLELDGMEGVRVDSSGAILEQELKVPPEGTRLGGSESSIDVYELPQEDDPAGIREGDAITRESANDPILIRAEFDMPDTTLGYNNTYNFSAGQKYRVPRWVAKHFSDKGLCTVLSAG
jgi:hypothetical protein